MFWPLTLIGKPRTIKAKAADDLDWSQRELYRLEKVIEEATMVRDMHIARIVRLRAILKPDYNENAQ